MKNIINNQVELIERLKTIDPKIEVCWDEIRGICSSVRGNLWAATEEEKQKGAKLSLENKLSKFLEIYGDLFGIPDPITSSVKISSKEDDIGWTHFSLQYSLCLDKNEPLIVYGSKLAAHFDNAGKLIQVQSSLWRDLRVDAEKIRITPKELPEIVLKKIANLPGFDRLKQKMIRENKEFPLTDEPRLVVYPWKSRFPLVWVTYGYGAHDKDNNGRPVDVSAIAYGKIFIDAESGEQIIFAPAMQTAETPDTGSGLAVTPVAGTKMTRVLNIVRVDTSSTYLLKDKTHNRDIVTFDAACNTAYNSNAEIGPAINNGTLPVSEDTEGDMSWDRLPTSSTSTQRISGQQPEVDAHYFARQQYEWYDAVAGGRIGWDDNKYADPPVPPQTINVLAHCRWTDDPNTGAIGSCNLNNAYKWSRKDGGKFTFWLAFQEGDAATYDYMAGSHFIFAHEYQHAITDFTYEDGLGNPGLEYVGWLGAVHEGLSDVFGTLSTEQWLPCHDISLVTPPKVYRNPVFPRDVAAYDPKNSDHFLDGITVTDFYSRGTILAHCAYLMGRGGVHQRSMRIPILIPVYGLGREIMGGKDILKAARIWYRALTWYFSTHGALTGIPKDDQNSFRDLRNGCVWSAEDLYKKNSLEHCNTIQAFYAVGLHPTTESYGADVTFLRWGISWDLSRSYVGLNCGDYQSLDLFVNNGGASEWNALINVIDPSTSKPTQFENTVYCRVRNVGDLPANDVKVQFFYAKAGTANWTWLPVTDKNGIVQILDIGILAAGQSNFSDSDQNNPPSFAGIKWYIPPLGALEIVDHFCLKAVVSTSSKDVNPHNNEVQTNIAYTAYTSPAPATAHFVIGNPFKDKEIPVILKLESILPKGWEVTTLDDLKGMHLKPGESRICGVKVHMPPGADARLEAPFDGSLDGHLYGAIAGPFMGSLTDAVLEGTGMTGICGRFAAQIPHIGPFVGTLTGTIDLTTGQVKGKAIGSHTCDNADKQFSIGVEACLRPWRRVEISQWDGKNLLGGLTVQVQVPLKASGPCARVLPPTNTRVILPEPTPVPIPPETIRGKVARILYDSCGDFMGFVLSMCPGERTFYIRDSGLKHLIIEACEKHWTITVVPRANEPSGVLRIEVHC